MVFMKKNSSLFTVVRMIMFISAAVITQNMAIAQNMDNETGGARMEKIERDLMLLQRQISRSSGSASNSSAPMGNADFEVRLSTIEEQIRDLVGKMEKNDFQIRKLSENLDKLQRDTDFRFGEITNAPNTSPPPASGQATTMKERKVPDENLLTNSERDKTAKSVGKTIDTVSNAHEYSSSDNINDDDNDNIAETNFSNPRDHYNYAFRLLNQTQYDKAAASFADFIKKHPKDPLVGNAYYWRGETFYIRRDYVKAADSFRQGFEEMPNGPKAPDNLLKLAMTLNALKRNKEACVVLGQVVSKFQITSSAVSQKAQQEQKRIDCK